MPLPDVIGRYRIKRMLGRGAMGVIYQAHDPMIGREIAIKLIQADLLQGEDRADYIARFQREAQAAGRCMHPNIVAVYDFSMHDGNPFLVMEFVEGVNLADVMRQRGRFVPEDAVAIMLQMLEALACAHAIGVVHRDVKPANVLLLPGNRVKMMDFGIARFDTSELTQRGTMIGTLNYISPEQCRGQEVDARSDLFSAGSVLYEMLLGARPFAGRDASEVMYRLLNEAPANFDTPGDSLSQSRLATVLRKALAKAPHDRFNSAQDMATALRAAPLGAPPSDASHVALFKTPPPDVDATTVARQTRLRISPVEAARAERALAEHLGPIAKVLVKRALQTAESSTALWENLADHIKQKSERELFLRQRDK